jgi:hypothetical protein
MLTIAFVLVAAGFPLVALMTRRRSPKALWLTTGAAALVILALALFLATPWAGNRLVATEGYARVAFGVVRMALVLFVFPIVLSAAAIAWLGGRAEGWLGYPIAIAAMLIGFFIGIIALFWIAY